jgi:ACS family glucarate transporter-like MFS transporter
MTTAASGGSRVRWTVLALICLASSVAYVLRIDVSIAAVAMRSDLGLSEVQLGAVLAAFAWGYGLSQVPGGLLGEAIGARRTMAASAAAWGLLTLVMGLLPGEGLLPIWACVGALGALRFAMGVAQAPLYPVTGGISTVVWFPPRRWAFVNGLSTTALTLGAAAAGPGVERLVAALGWRLAFLAVAPLGAAAAGLWWWLYRDDPAEHPRVAPAELALIRAGRPEPGEARPRASWRAVLRRPGVAAITASYFCANYVFYLFFNWFFYYLVEVRGVPPAAGGAFTAAQWMVGAVAAVGGGWLCDRASVAWGSRVACRATVVGGLLACAPLLLAGSLTRDPLPAVVLLSLAFGALQATDGAFWAAAMRLGGEHAAAATGLMNTGGNVVGGVAALLVPLVAGAWGWTVAVATGTPFALAAAALWTWIRADEP